MKNLLIIIGLLFTLASCEKESDEEHCYDCLLHTWGQGQSLSQTYNECGTQDQIEAYENEHTGSDWGVSFTMNCEISD